MRPSSALLTCLLGRPRANPAPWGPTTNFSEPKLSPAWCHHPPDCTVISSPEGFPSSRALPTQCLVGKHLPTRPLLCALPALPLCTCSHTMLRCSPSSPAAPHLTGSAVRGEKLARAQLSSAQLAGSARARLAASVPPPPSASPGASFPWAPWGWAPLRCSVGAKNPAQSKHNNPVWSKHSVSVKPAGPCLRQRSCCRHRLYGGSG